MNYRGLTLDPFQQSAIAALQRKHSVLVSAPTGTGKTIIADWIVERALSTGKQVIYTAPIKALSNQKFRDYCRHHGEENVGLVTGDLVIRRDAPCLVMTTEILRNILLGDEPLDDLMAVVLDEIHFLDDRERGTVWEEVLIYLPPHVRIVGLSATLSNLDEFAGWLEHVRGHTVTVVREDERTVPLRFHHFSKDTGLVDPAVYEQKYKKRKGGETRQRGRNKKGRAAERRGRGRGRAGGTTHVDVFHAMRDNELLPYLYFVFSRRDTEALARALTRSLTTTLLSEEELARTDERIARASEEIGSALDEELIYMYRGGVAFHHAGLHVQLKNLVEELYEDKLLKVLYTTSTFALGINMPARSVVFDGVKKYDGRGVNPLTTRGFMQKAGRAGRRGMDDVGHVVLRMDFSDYTELRPLLARYREAVPEPVRSSFNLSFNSIVHLLERHDPDRIRDILDRSFLSWHLQRKAVTHARQADALRDGGTARAKREAKALEGRAERARSRVYDEYRAKVSYLQQVGYLSDNLTFNAGARLLRHLQIADVLVTELVLSGALEDLPPSTLFGICAGLTNSLPRQARPIGGPTVIERKISKAIRTVRMSPVVTQAETLSGQEVEWDPEVMILGRMWADGDDLETIVASVVSTTDLAGDLITGFRRAKDLASQLREVYAEDPDRRVLWTQIIRTVSRDEVEVVG